MRRVEIDAGNYGSSFYYPVSHRIASKQSFYYETGKTEIITSDKILIGNGSVYIALANGTR